MNNGKTKTRITEKFSDNMDLNTIKKLDQLCRDDGRGVNASKGVRYQTIFGRDSLEIGRAIIWLNPSLVKKIILTLGSYQGVRDDKKTDESEGKILHEIYGKEQKNKHILQKIINKIAIIVSGKEIRGHSISYISADSTPMFVNLIYDYYKKVSPDILKEKVIKQDGKSSSVYECAESAVNWIIKNIDKNNLVNVPRKNPLGNFFGQTWKDSLTAYIRPDGSLVNIKGDIIYPEIQMLCYEALINFTKITSKKNIKKIRLAKKSATKIKKSIFKNLWNNDDNFFVSCLEEKDDGVLSQVRTIESTAGRILDSSLFDKMNNRKRKYYISNIVTRLFSKEFLTDAGIRSRSLIYKDLFDVSDYHGCDVSWPIDTYLIARGLRRQGFNNLADQLENRIINSVNLSRINYEFFMINDDGELLNTSFSKNNNTDSNNTYDVQFEPEKDQGWTISSILSIKKGRKERLNKKFRNRRKWITNLENEILKDIKNVKEYNFDDLINNRPKNKNIKLNKTSGTLKTGFYLAKQIANQFFSRKSK